MNSPSADNLSASELRSLDKSIVWHAFSQMHEYDGLVIDHAQGCWLTDIDGRRYLDGASSMILDGTFT